MKSSNISQWISVLKNYLSLRLSAGSIAKQQDVLLWRQAYVTIARALCDWTMIGHFSDESKLGGGGGGEA